MDIVSKWQCADCLASAEIHRADRRWKIIHMQVCGVLPGVVEDVGPLTAVNDPGNAYLVPED